MALEQYAEALDTLQKALQIYNNTSDSNSQTSNDNEEKTKKQEQAEFQKLIVLIHKKQQQKHKNKDKEKTPSTTIKSTEIPAPSIRDFTKSKTLGEGNFSKVVMCTHNTTNETFALKIINKDEAAKLAKRQHPNVYNEIQMERKLLCEKLNSEEAAHPNIVRCWHAFQDYENLYYLQNFCEGGDLWSRLFHKKAMVGCHFSLIRPYMHQILSGIEHIHAHGMVHRDLKPENILLDASGRPIIIDFGTAKDLIDTELNGPEFVGTPDFMTPEAVNDKTSSFEADLWTFGAILFQMYTGLTPFNSVSPYMTFLRIKRANVTRKLGIVDDDAWDLITKMMQADSQKRLGAGSFCIKEEDGKREVIKKTKNGYDDVRNHPFFQEIEKESKRPGFEYRTSPTSSDLEIRTYADMVYEDSQNLEIPDPGDGSSHDMLRLPISDRMRIMHALDRMHLLHKPRVYRRFFASRQETRLEKVRPESRDYVGLTIEECPLDEQQQQMDEGIKIVIKYIFLMNPIFSGGGLEDEEENLRYLKECVRKINKLRPKLVVVCGSTCAHHQKVRKLLAKINESINVVINDGRNFFTIWMSRSVQALIINKKKINEDDLEHRLWMNEELEQFRVARNTSLVFCDCDPNSLSERTKQKLAKSKVRCVYGIQDSADQNSFEEKEYKFTPSKDQTEPTQKDEEDPDSSDDEEEDNTTYKMKLFSGNKSMHLISVEEESGEIKSEEIEVP